MKRNKITLSREQLEEAIQLFNRSMDDYLYLFDLQNDYYTISKHAIDRFCLPNYHFNDAENEHNHFVYKEDLPLLFNEFHKIKSGEITEHSLHYRWLDKNHNPVWINCRGDVILDEFNKPLYLIGCVNEIGKKQKADNVSGLLKESGLEVYLSKNKEMSGFLMQIGIDDFEEINGRFGLKYGEEILKQFSNCMQETLKDKQKLYDLGNGRFILMSLPYQNKKDALEIYNELKKSVEKLLEANAYHTVFTISAGIVEVNGENHDYDTLVKYTEFALNEAKKKGKNSSYIFTKVKYDQFIRRREIRVELQNSIDHDFVGFETYYQPIVNIHTGKLIGAEALMRFKMKRGDQIELISPVEFIPILEESGLIIPAGRWILREAVECCKRWQKDIPHFKVNVNLSYVQIIKSSILDEIKQALKDFDLAPSLLGIEVTESGYLENTYHYKKLWSSLKKEGITLILDDYGTGYSNAYRLGNLTPHYIKIDRVLTQKALSSSYERSILIYIIEMAHTLNLEVCIEGIETEEELQEIKKLNPDYIQGYLFGKPAPEDEFYNQQIKKK